MPRQVRYPVSSFGPELLAFLTKAGREKVVLRFDGERGRAAAATFVRRINMLRKAMERENHPLHRFAARAKAATYWGAKAFDHGGQPFAHWIDDHNAFYGAIVVGRPHDEEFLDVLSKAGIDVDKEDLERPSLDSIPASPSRDPTSLDMLSRILDDMETPEK